LTVGIKLTPNAAQSQALEKTLRLANEAANECSRIAWEHQIFGQFQLHQLAYKEIREKFGLSAQVAVRVIAKVADAYKLDKKSQRVFRFDGSIAFDDRILRYGEDHVSIWTTAGRQKIGFVTGEKQKKLLESRQGESDLVFRDGKWFLFATVNVIEPPTNDDPDGFLGVDLGIARIATDSDGQSFSGSQVRNLRKRHRRLRSNLQAKKTKSAKRRLRDRKRKEARYASDLNHQISKKIVEKAKHTNRAIVLEDLKGIRSRVRVQKARRAELGSWSFGQLRGYIEYKAKLAGVEVITIDPRNTSRECSLCGHIEKLNRRSQKSFQCRQCDHQSNADVNAARVIASRGAFNRPNAGASATRNLHL